MRTLKPTDRSGEQGIALVMALLMVLAVSVVTGSLVMVARSEALSSTSYTSMSQGRYGAESGVHAAANYLLFMYASPSAASATDPFANYNMAVSPVRYNNAAVVLSSDPAIASNYPNPAVVNAFVANSVGNLNVNGAPVAYAARATLMSMSTVTDYYTQQPITLQTWRIEGLGRINGSGQSLVEVEGTLERRPTPVFAYAAFATDNGCNAMSFAGGADTNSYDSGNLALGASNPPTGGNVGTNGSLDGNGGTTDINGTLSTPRSGVGNCTSNNVTAATISGFATVSEGLVQLPQPINLPTPPVPTAGTTDYHFTSSSGCTGAPFCAMISGKPTIVPPTSSTVIPMRDVDMNGSSELHLRAGIYEVNSLTLNGGAKIVVDSGPVIIKVKGMTSSGGTMNTPLDLSGGGVSNPSMNPQNLQFVYAGTGNVKITGGSTTAALVYAPNASGSFSGASTNFYGAVVTKYVTSMGGFSLFYDRRLLNTVMTAGPHLMTAFTWKTF
jgi:hypothetical protein